MLRGMASLRQTVILMWVEVYSQYIYLLIHRIWFRPSNRKSSDIHNVCEISAKTKQNINRKTKGIESIANNKDCDRSCDQWNGKWGMSTESNILSTHTKYSLTVGRLCTQAAIKWVDSSLMNSWTDHRIAHWLDWHT